MIHGGAIFGLIHEAFNAASNSHGTIAMAVNVNIAFINPPHVGSLLTAEAREKSRSNNTALYVVEVNEDDDNGIQRIVVC